MQQTIASLKTYKAQVEKLQGKADESTIILGNFYTVFSATERTMM